MSNTSSIIRCRNAAKMKITHAFHFVELSPWPLLASSGCGTLTVGCVMYFHNYELGLLVLALGLVLIGSVLSIWWRDVIREGLFQGNHTVLLQAMMIEGFVLFILSEVMFFVAWFWAFFHCSLAPPVELGCVWPSNCIDLISTWGVPWFNTVLLLSSGATVTLCHHCLMCSRYKHSLVSLQATIWLAWIFTFWQGYEYQTTWLNISDGNAGSTDLMWDTTTISWCSKRQLTLMASQTITSLLATRYDHLSNRLSRNSCAHWDDLPNYFHGSTIVLPLFFNASIWVWSC